MTLDPDKLFGPCAVTVNTYQMAVQVCLEAFGTTVAAIPVVMPVTSSPQVMAGVLRAGAQPVLLDIDPVTLQLQPDVVRECLVELPGCIILLNRPMGLQVTDELQEVTKGSPTIVDTRLEPYPDLPASELVGTCNIYDLGPTLGEGAVILEKHTDLQDVLRSVRSGLLGLSGALTQSQAGRLKIHYNDDHTEKMYASSRTALSEYNRILSEYNLHDRMHFNSSQFPHYVLLKCENPKRVMAYLGQYNIQAMHGVYGLHNFSEIKDRYSQVPSYPNADAAQNSLVALPLEHPEDVVRFFSEVQ